MKVHALQTGTVLVRTRQREGSGRGPLRALNTMLDRQWTEPLPILAWAIEHPEGVIVVDTGETARAAQPGWFPRWQPYFRLAVRVYVTSDQEIGPALRAAGLDPDAFWQIHRGVLVAVRAIARARRDELGNITVELREHPQQLKVSQTYAWRFKNEVSFR